MATTLPPRPAALFVGDHLALDFLNTRSTPSGVWTDWLRDGVDLIDWLEQAGAIEADIATKFRAESDAADQLDSVAERARGLREWLRAFVEQRAGRELGADVVGALAPLNRLLAQDDSYSRVEADAGEGRDAGGLHRHILRKRRVQRWTMVEQLLQPVAEAIADLICHADFRRIHSCDGSECVLMFLDRTKAGGRRWCSMATCGNRAKVAAHRARAAGARG
jgi:predicted RNA-binding Zn ribbon-like protein